jgi:uncharacterized integral membrane protein
MEVNNEKELGEALKKNANRIEIEGDLARKVIRIKATGKVAWAVCFGALTLAIIAVIATVGTGGAAASAAVASGIIAGPAAIGVLGAPAAGAAIAIAVAGGGAGILNKLRKYKLIKKGNKVVLEK